MAHSHEHHNFRRVLIALVLTASFMVVEVIGGILSGSLALLADAGHMLTDTMALTLAAVAFHVSERPARPALSYGYQRFQILAAFVNGLALLAVVGWIFVEAVRRFVSPPEIIAGTMFKVALLGLVVNIIAFAVLHGGDRDNLNIRGAALHVAGDLLGSVAAIVASIVILYTGIVIVDPVLSIAVAFLILRSAWILVKRSAHVLLQGAPEWLDTAAMEARIVAQVPMVRSVHHVHVWGLTPQDLILTMHVELDPACAMPTEQIRSVKSLLDEEYGIGHSTIEIEFDLCADHAEPTTGEISTKN